MTNSTAQDGSQSMTDKARETIKGVVNPDTKSQIVASTKFKENPAVTMKAAEWHATKSIKLQTRQAPTITDPNDVIVKITNTTVCGSDLHEYFNEVPGVQVMQKHDIIGHEAVGVISEVGPQVKNRTVGQRVVISAVISCGACSYCLEQKFSACDRTNPSGQMEQLYGHRCAALFGYSQLTGGYAGLQAETARVPFAEQNTLPIPDDVSDEQALTLADIFCTGFHGNELSETGPGKVVVVFGLGPVGVAAVQCALARGSTKVYGVDNDKFRLSVCKLSGGIPINFDDHKEGIDKFLLKEIEGGADCSIDCVGFRFPKSWSHKFQRLLKLETDSPEVVNACIQITKKCGNIALIGDYFASANGFNLGNFMEKGLTMRGGQLFCQKYWKQLMSWIQQGKLHPYRIFTHRMNFSQIEEAYDIFANHKDDCLKIILKTDYGIEQEKIKGINNPMGRITKTD